MSEYAQVEPARWNPENFFAASAARLRGRPVPWDQRHGESPGQNFLWLLSLPGESSVPATRAQ